MLKATTVCARSVQRATALPWQGGISDCRLFGVLLVKQMFCHRFGLPVGKLASCLYKRKGENTDGAGYKPVASGSERPRSVSGVTAQQ